jgi:hypothetical protein
MKALCTVGFCSSLLLLFLCLSAMAAQTAPQEPTADNPSRVQMQEALRRYTGAYAHKNFQELLAVWPDLSKEKKEAQKIQRHLEDGTVSDEQMAFQLLETDFNSEGATVHAQRTEQFVKAERTATISHGDLNMGNMPAQDPGPSQVEKKKSYKKADTVWIKLHRVGDSWTIASITSQKPQ